MGFFESFPPPEPPKQPRRPPRLPWRGPRFNVVPVALAVDAVLARDATKAIYANGFDVYPYGFAFVVSSLIRRSEPVRGRPAVFAGTANPLGWLSPRSGEPLTPEETEQAFHIGVRYADGRAAEVKRSYGRFGETRPPEQPLLSLNSGHGGEHEWTQGLWAWGIPAAGDVELVYRWPAEQISESSVILDGDLLRAAAARAVTLWDDEPEDGGDGDARG